jgi:hypothetical protein
MLKIAKKLPEAVQELKSQEVDVFYSFICLLSLTWF